MFALFMLEHVSNDRYGQPTGELMPLLPMATRFHPSLQTRKRNPYPAVGIYVNGLCRAVIMSSGLCFYKLRAWPSASGTAREPVLCHARLLSTSCCASPHPIKPITTYFY